MDATLQSNADAVLAIDGGTGADATLRLHFVGGNPHLQPIGLNVANGTDAFTPTDSRPGENGFDKVKFRNVYPGIDVVYQTRQNHLQFIFLVHPAANPRKIKIAYQGAQGLQLDADGNVIVTSVSGHLIQEAPHLFQTVHGVRRPIDGHYRLDAKGHVRFQISAYNPRRALVIDPGINAPPTANDDFYTTRHDTQLVVGVPGVLANDTDPDFDLLTSALVSGPSHGTLTFASDGSFTYAPSTHFVGSDAFTYKANDGVADSNTATVAIDVPDNAPSSGDDSFSVLHDHTLTVDAAGVLGNDYDPDGDPITAELVAGPTHGTLTLNAAGSLSYTPAAGFAGTDSFTYDATDGMVDGNVATVFIYVTNVAPFAVADFYSVHAGNSINVAQPGVLGNDYDSDGDPLTAAIVSGPTHGTLGFDSSGSFSYTPNEGFLGNDTFTYTANDGIAHSEAATATISVYGMYPIANNDEYAVGTNQLLTVNAPGVLWNDVSPEGSPLTAVLVGGPSNGGLSLVADGSFVYTPSTDFAGDDSFTYNAKTNGLLSLTPATVLIHVVSIDLQMAGVGAGQKLTPGGFVMVNANDDNGSPMVNNIPQRRDFDMNPIVNPMGAFVADPDLTQVNVVVNPNLAALPGFFVLSIGTTGTARIRLWTSRNKINPVLPGVYAPAALPPWFFVEGMEVSMSLRDISINLQYLYISSLGVPTAASSDTVKVTVTPAIRGFSIVGGNVRFNNGVDGLGGIQAVGPGATFGALLTTTGAAGTAVFIQNVTAYQNGPARGGPGITRIGVPNQNSVLLAGRNFPLLDRVNAPPPPDYDAGFNSVVGPMNALTISAQDSPGFIFGAANWAQVDIREFFIVYLVWRFADNSIYTLGTDRWNFDILADTFVAGRGVTRLVPPPAGGGIGTGVFPDAAATLEHPNPAALVAPIANGSFVFVNA